MVGNPNSYSQRIQRVTDYLAEHLDEALDLETLARVAFLSPYHFHRVYRGLLGETVNDTVRRLRLHRAALDLLDRELSIERTARRAGYTSQAAFTRAFRAEYGVPPARYRGAQREAQHAREPSSAPYRVELVEVPRLRVATIEHRGDYRLTSKAFERLMTIAATTGLLGGDTRTIGIYHDDPESVPTAELRSPPASASPSAGFLPVSSARAMSRVGGTRGSCTGDPTRSSGLRTTGSTKLGSRQVPRSRAISRASRNTSTILGKYLLKNWKLPCSCRWFRRRGNGGEVGVSSRFVASLSLLVFLPLAAPAQPASFEDRVGEYLRRFPYQATYDYTVRYTGGDPRNLNGWMPKGEPTLVRAGDDIVPRTNNDTYSKGAALSLADGPVVLEATAPTRERFNSFQLVDDRNANFRNIVRPAGKYTLYFGKRPAVFEGEAIEVPSPFAIVVARVEVRDKGDPADVAAARAVYLGMKIAGVPPAEFPRLDLLSEFSADVVAEANRRMDEVFETVRFTETVVGPGKEPGREVSVLYHAAGTKGGWGAPDPAHSAYEAVFRDANGSELRGRDGPYAVTTEAPPVDAFWSVTVYDTERGGRLHPNSANRYHVNDTTAARNADGTATFTFALACAPEADNCLEVPPGRFDVTIRYFLPRQPIISGAWRFPGIERLADSRKSSANH